jgi:hypothetical protein
LGGVLISLNVSVISFLMFSEVVGIYTPEKLLLAQILPIFVEVIDSPS